MVFTSHSVLFSATRALGHSWLEMAPRERQKPFHFPHTSNGNQIFIPNSTLGYFAESVQSNIYWHVCHSKTARLDALTLQWADGG